MNLIFVKVFWDDKVRSTQSIKSDQKNSTMEKSACDSILFRIQLEFKYKRLYLGSLN